MGQVTLKVLMWSILTLPKGRSWIGRPLVRWYTCDANHVSFSCEVTSEILVFLQGGVCEDTRCPVFASCSQPECWRDRRGRERCRVDAGTPSLFSCIDSAAAVSF